jgi:hypothetical protein
MAILNAKNAESAEILCRRYAVNANGPVCGVTELCALRDLGVQK